MLLVGMFCVPLQGKDTGVGMPTPYVENIIFSRIKVVGATIVSSRTYVLPIRRR